MTQVAISSDFLTAIFNLPKTQQKKVNNIVTKFKNDPHSSGINYEKINDAANQYMRSVRIDQAYRGIILKPESGDVFILLWVDHHDKAYDWARKHQCKINATTGSIQLYETEVIRKSETSITIEPGKEQVPEKTSKLFYEFTENELLNIGLPEELLAEVRNITDITELNNFKSSLPEDAFQPSL